MFVVFEGQQIQSSFLSLDAAVYVLTVVQADSRAFKDYQINKQSIITIAWLTRGAATLGISTMKQNTDHHQVVSIVFFFFF